MNECEEYFCYHLECDFKPTKCYYCYRLHMQKTVHFTNEEGTICIHKRIPIGSVACKHDKECQMFYGN